ncbi:S-layer homology domain-containing protein [Egicoccus halophilus]|uniref:SLH domain-containing protein n=1 Tax=Egicoccus halophilus TaxID=1670830 RepID=A0A8J3AB09_9ACTN|nr:S-layer homology domain-containing protein [Egicoccus halophilus]GGI09143.1 hypothetical protein GCM10011354_32610 [Egicoccus halophilus]
MRILRGGGRGIVAGTAVAALLVPTTAVAQTADTPAPAPVAETASDAAGAWLAGQLVEGERIETTFDGSSYVDHGLTADTVYALAGAGVAGADITAATDWLATQVVQYAGDGEEEAYAGATAKLILVAETAGRDATDFGGVNLVERLQDRQDVLGRYRDVSPWGDYSNVLTQSLALIALERATDEGPSDAAVELLVDTACENGGYPSSFPTDTCTSDVDATGFAVQALLAVGADDAADAAVDWLLDEQADDGSFGGPEAAANSNSTGLAAVALVAAGELEAFEAAAEWLATVQYACFEADAGAIPFTFDEAGDLTRATAQALPGLSGVPLTETTIDSAVAGAPNPSCLRFPDVVPGSAHAQSIAVLDAAGIIAGRTDGTFAPRAGVTRGQLASFLGRASGITPASGPTRFTDVPANATHAGYIEALAEEGIVFGYSDDTFRPGQLVRRDQSAALIARWLDLDPVDTDRFTDIAGIQHRQQINALRDAEVAFGTGDGTTFTPGATMRRDQVASLLWRALQVADAS